MSLRSNFLTIIDESVVYGIGSFEPLKKYREHLRGGEEYGQGENIRIGHVPEYLSGNNCYSVQDEHCPCVFVSDADAEFNEECLLVYRLEIVCVLPRIVLGKRLTVIQIQDVAEKLSQALHAGKSLAGTTIFDRLSRQNLSSVIADFQVLRINVEGTDQQQRIVATIQIPIPQRELLSY